MKPRFLTLMGLAAVAAIALAWSAFAAEGENQGQGNGQSADRWEMPVPPPQGGQTFQFRGRDGEEMPPPPPMHGPGGPGAPGGPAGPLGGELTYGELHVQRDGEDVVVRVDAGEVAAVDSDSILVAENDGSEVEIPVDDETEIHAGPFEGDVSIEDLEEGDKVHVSRVDGEPAESIGVLPDIEDLPAPPQAPQQEQAQRIAPPLAANQEGRPGMRSAVPPLVVQGFRA